MDKNLLMIESKKGNKKRINVFQHSIMLHSILQGGAEG